ncbi:basic proline-rich protein-like [Mustela nigripes]|uniref:basic proline-rich protein-like n=1 Tax=Mustela nigripes TaxID=77151 RepID=UPI0028161707|nr:basic proline-rich protein-like [Mustela nigripes]
MPAPPRQRPRHTAQGFLAGGERTGPPCQGAFCRVSPAHHHTPSSPAFQTPAPARHGPSYAGTSGERDARLGPHPQAAFGTNTEMPAPTAPFVTCEPGRDKEAECSPRGPGWPGTGVGADDRFAALRTSTADHTGQVSAGCGLRKHFGEKPPRGHRQAMPLRTRPPGEDRERGLRQEDGTDLALLKPECSPFLQTPQETGKREAGLPDVLASTRSTFLPFLDSNARLESGARDSEGVGELEKPPKPGRSSARENSGSHAEQRTSPHEPSPSCGCTVSGRAPSDEFNPKDTDPLDRLSTAILSPSPRDLSAELRLPKNSRVLGLSVDSDRAGSGRRAVTRLRKKPQCSGNPHPDGTLTPDPQTQSCRGGPEHRHRPGPRGGGWARLPHLRRRFPPHEGARGLRVAAAAWRARAHTYLCQPPGARRFLILGNFLNAPGQAPHFLPAAAPQCPGPAPRRCAPVPRAPGPSGGPLAPRRPRAPGPPCLPCAPVPLRPGQAPSAASAPAPCLPDLPASRSRPQPGAFLYRQGTTAKKDPPATSPAATWSFEAPTTLRAVAWEDNLAQGALYSQSPVLGPPADL